MKHSLQPSAQLTYLEGEPVACYHRWRETLQSGEGLLLVDFVFSPYWLENPQGLPLTAIYHVSGDELEVAVTDRALVAGGAPLRQQYLSWVEQHQLLSFTGTQAIELQPQSIAKPWGQEIWYTGVERRGVCNFTGAGASTPIPWLQAAVPAAAAGPPGEPLVLLKILAPSAQPVQGDLYFELHEKKREVYVVTQIDPGAWPDGTGYIRYGFDPQQVAAYASDEAFRSAYLDTVQVYEKQRRKLDQLAERGIAPDSEEIAQERFLRHQMEGFTRMLPLRVGDAIQVPPLLPHALQHGVRVVEFQTPSYERKIISFAQKVLTQEHWDSREAIAQMLLAPPASEPAEPQPGSSGVSVEQIVDFPDFEVMRVSVAAGSNWAFEAGPSYRLLIVVSGVLAVSGVRYESEQALLLPYSWRGELAAPEAAAALVFLLATPRS